MTYTPSKFPATLTSVSNSGGSASWSGANTTFGSITATRTGQWDFKGIFTVTAAGHFPTGFNAPTIDILKNGASQGPVTVCMVRSSDGIGSASFTVSVQGISVTSGDTISFATTAGTPSTGSYDSWAITGYFIPTPANPQ